MKKSVPLVTIVIINFNGKKYLNTCLKSLKNLNYPPRKVEIIMVDNNSTDGSLKFVSGKFPNVKIIENSINNYCKANNLGIKAARGEYIAMLNNDTRVDKNWLRELVRTMQENKHAGALSSKILFMDGKIQSTGHQEYPNFYWGDRGFKEADKGQYNRLEEVTSICGGAVLYRKTCLDEVGLLDEDFIMYLDDVDMAIRCRQKGWKMLYVPKSIVYHVYNGTATKETETYYVERNRLLLVAKHFPKNLPRSFFGKGYFTKQNFEKLYEILPMVIAKLMENRKPDFVKDITEELFKELQKLLNYERDNFYKEIDNLNMLININKDRRTLRSLEKALAEIKQKEEDLKRKDQIIKQRDALIKEKDNYLNKNTILFSLKDKEIISRDAIIKKKDNTIASLEKILADKKQKELDLKDKDKLIKEKDRMIKERDDLIKENSSLISLKDKDLRDKEHIIAEREKEITLKELDLKDKDKLIKEKDRMIKERDDLIKENSSLISLKDKDLKDKERIVAEREKEITLKDQKIYNLNAELSRLLESFQHQKVELEGRGRLVKEKEAVIEERDKIIQERDRVIVQKDNDIIAQDKDIDDKKSRIAELEKEIVRLSHDIKLQLKDAQGKEDVITKLSKDIDIIAKEKESIVLSKDRIITQKDNEIVSKDKELNSKNSKILELNMEVARLLYDLKSQRKEVEGKERIITRLYKDIDFLTREKESIIKQRDKMITERDRAIVGKDKELSSKNSKFEQLNIQLNKYLNNLEIRSKEVKSKEEIIRNLNKRIDILMHEKTVAIADKDKIIAQRDELVLSKDKELNDKNNKILELNNEINRIGYNWKLQIKESEAKQQFITKILKDLEVLTREKEIIIAGKDNINNKVLGLNNEVNRLTYELKFQMEEGKSKEETIEKLLKDIELITKEKSAIITSKDNVIAQREELVRSKDRELNDKNIKILELNKGIDKLSYELKLQTEEVKSKEEMISRLNRDLNFRMKEIQTKEENIIKLLQDIDSLNKEKESIIRSKNDEIQIKNQQLAQRDDEIVLKNNEIEAKERLIAGLNERINLAHERIEDIASGKERLEIALNNRSAELDVLGARISAMDSEIKEKNGVLNSIQEELSEIKNSLYYRLIHHPVSWANDAIKRRLHKTKTIIGRKKSNIKNGVEKFLQILAKNKFFIKFYDSNNIISKILQAIRRRSNHWLRVYKRHIKTGENPPTPETLILMLTKKCNLKCEFCDIHDLTEEMKTEDALKIIDNVSRIGIRSLVITGGEPFLHRDLFKITMYAKSKGLDVCITTNGTLILDRLEEIVNSMVDTLSVSLDGLEDTHDEMRGRKGVFDKVQRGIEELQALKCNVALNFVLTKKNIAQLEKVYSWANERNIFFDFWPVNYCRDLYINQNGDYGLLSKFAKKLKHNGKIRRCKYYYFKKVPLYLRKNIDLNVRCLGLSRHIGVDVRGHVMPCCVWGKDRINLGNAINDDMMLLWNSRRYHQVRRDIFYKGCSGGCYNQSLHEFMTITGHNFIVNIKKKRA